MQRAAGACGRAGRHAHRGKSRGVQFRAPCPGLAVRRPAGSSRACERFCCGPRGTGTRPSAGDGRFPHDSGQAAQAAVPPAEAGIELRRAPGPDSPLLPAQRPQPGALRRAPATRHAPRPAPALGRGCLVARPQRAGRPRQSERGHRPAAPARRPRGAAGRRLPAAGGVRPGPGDPEAAHAHPARARAAQALGADHGDASHRGGHRLRVRQGTDSPRHELRPRQLRTRHAGRLGEDGAQCPPRLEAGSASRARC